MGLIIDFHRIVFDASRRPLQVPMGDAHFRGWKVLF